LVSVSGDIFAEESVPNVVMTEIHFKEKSTTLTCETTVIADSDEATKQSDDGGIDAVVDVMPQYLQHLDQRKTMLEFSTAAQQETDENETVDADSEISICSCSADVSEVGVEFVQSDVTRIAANSVEQSVPCHDEPAISELGLVPQSESALESETPHEFSTAECIHRPQTGTVQDDCAFAEETTESEIPELMSENAEEPSEIAVCLERSELSGKSVAESAEQLLVTAEELAPDSVEETPASEQVEGCEVASETAHAEQRQKIVSATGTESWSLESDDVDDFFEMAYDGKLSPEEIPSEAVDLETKTQPVCSSSDQLAPDVFDGSTEDIPALETEDVIPPSEIPLGTVVLEEQKLENSYTSDQVLIVVDEEDQVKELEMDSEEVAVAPEEISSEFVVVEVAGLKTVNADQLESPAEEDRPTEVLSGWETMEASCDEIQSEFVQPSSIEISLVNCVSDGVTEVNEPDQYSDVAPFDEENVAEPEEISLSLVSTSVADKVENLTTQLVEESSFDGTLDDVAAVEEEKVAEPEEINSSLVSTSVVAPVESLSTQLIDKSPFDDSIADEPAVEMVELPEPTVLDSPVVSEDMVKLREESYSSEQTGVVQEGSLGDSVGELCTDSVEGEMVENLSAEAGSVGDLPESCVVMVKEEQLEEEFYDLPDDISPTSFVSEITEDADTNVVRLPIIVVSYGEFESATFLTKIQQQTAEPQLLVIEEDLCSEVEDTAEAEAAVLGEVSVELETAETAPELEVYEMFIEEEETTIVEEKIIESIVTTVSSEKRSSLELQEERVTVTAEGTACSNGLLAWHEKWHGVSSFLLLAVNELHSPFVFL